MAKLNEFVDAPAPASQLGQAPNPSQELQKVLTALETTEPEIQFVKQDGQVALDRAALEMVFSSYSQSMQNPQVYNKWLGIDEKMAKAMRVYKSDVRLLIAEQAQQGQAQAMVQDQIPGAPMASAPGAPAPGGAPAPSPAPAPAPSGPEGKNVTPR